MTDAVLQYPILLILFLLSTLIFSAPLAAIISLNNQSRASILFIMSALLLIGIWSNMSYSDWEFVHYYVAGIFFVAGLIVVRVYYFNKKNPIRDNEPKQ